MGDCSSRPATNTATRRASSIPRSGNRHARPSCWAGATAWRPASCCVSPASTPIVQVGARIRPSSHLARTTLREANKGALDDPRVDVVIDDAMTWLREPAASVRREDSTR